MEQLQVVLGQQARATLCTAFDLARSSIDAEVHCISDPKVVDSINRAASRHVAVTLHVEGDPSRFWRTPKSAQDCVTCDTPVRDALRREFSPDVNLVVEDCAGEMWHSKAVVVDEKTAFIATANPTKPGFSSEGEVLIKDELPWDVAAVQASIDGHAGAGQYVVSGPAAVLRERVTHLFNDRNDLRIATEDLSDKTIVALLKTRAAHGHYDRVLLDANRSSHLSPYAKGAITRLRNGGVDVRTLPKGLMHEKYVDDGSEIYVGSANLTRNGLDEAHEVGVVAPATAFGDGAQMLRDDFDSNWKLAIPA